jgi:hypothetical protein
MKVKALIDRIKAECGSFSNRVAGTAEFEDSVEKSDLAVPYAFVIPLSEEVGENVTAGSVITQMIDDRFGIIVCVSNTADPRGQAGGEALDDLRTELLDALLGWEPDASHVGMEYRGGRHLAMNRARLWHQFDFAAQYVLQS